MPMRRMVREGARTRGMVRGVCRSEQSEQSEESERFGQLEQAERFGRFGWPGSPDAGTVLVWAINP